MLSFRLPYDNETGADNETIRLIVVHRSTGKRIGEVTDVRLTSREEALTPTELSRFPWTRWLGVSASYAHARMVDDPWAMEGAVVDDGAGRRATRAAVTAISATKFDVPKKRPGRHGHEPGFYESVARRYGELRADPTVSAPATRLAEEHLQSLATVNGWLTQCRRRGLLPPSSRGHQRKDRS